MSGVISWEEPPAHGPGQYNSKWRRVAAQLRRRPGVWAHVETKHTSHAATTVVAGIHRGTYADMPAGAFEATSRKVAEGDCRVYARFVGEPS